MKQIFSLRPGSGRKSACASKQDEIISDLESHDYLCVRQIQKMIEEKICASVSLAAVKAFLHRLGYKWLKCGSLPAKADPEVQREFYDKTEKPLMELDASHFVMGNIHLGYVWSKQRRFLSTFTGRVRYNVLGALNFATKEMTTVTNNTYITATQVVELLDKLANKYADRPIILILDNASYQKCNFVQEYTGALVIKLEFLPPYSHNLNRIERFWKLVKKELGCAYFNVFEAFCRNIDLLCNSTQTELKAKMDTLIGDKVQLYLMG
jgi:transposase